MTVVSHVRELRKKHQALSEAVEEAQKSLAIDDLQVATNDISGSTAEGFITMAALVQLLQSTFE